MCTPAPPTVVPLWKQLGSPMAPRQPHGSPTTFRVPSGHRVGHGDRRTWGTGGDPASQPLHPLPPGEEGREDAMARDVTAKASAHQRANQAKRGLDGAFFHHCAHQLAPAAGKTSRESRRLPKTQWAAHRQLHGVILTLFRWANPRILCPGMQEQDPPILILPWGRSRYPRELFWGQPGAL